MSENPKADNGATVPNIQPATTIARNAFNLLLGQLTTTALAVVLSAALGRSLGAHDFGIYYLMTTTSAFAFVLVEWGQPLLVIRLLAQTPQRSGVVLGTALFLRTIFTLVVTVPAGLVSWFLGYGLHTTSLTVYLILATLPVFLAQGYGMAFRAHDQMGRDATVSVTNKAITLGLTLPALALGMAIPGVVFAQAVAGIVALGVAILLYRRLGAPTLRISSETARELFVAGTPILALTAATSIQPYLDAIVLSKFAPTAVVGWFGAARNILGTLIAPATILGAAAYPRIARASSDREAFRKEVAGALRPLLWLGALAGCGTYLFAQTVISLIYGAKGFGPAATILQVFAPGFLLLFIDILLGNIIYASGRGTGFAVAKVISVAVGTGLDFLFIPWSQRHLGNGGIGVLMAFGLSEFVVFAGAILTLPPKTFQKSAWLDVLRALGAGGATILLFRIFPTLHPGFGIPLSVVTFAIASFAFGLATRRDLEMIRSLVRRGK